MAYAAHPPTPGPVPQPNGMFDRSREVARSPYPMHHTNGPQGGRSETGVPTGQWRVHIDFGPGQPVRVRVNGQMWVPGRIVNHRWPKFEWQQVEYNVEYQWGGGWRAGLFKADDLQQGY